MWQPTVIASGKMTAQSQPRICQPAGTAGVARTTMPAARSVHTTSASQKRRAILGTSIQKFERSTSFFVAPHVMLYEKQCARIACETGIDSPPKKKKLK